MKKYWQIIAAVFILASLVSPIGVSAQNLQDFKFESFDADYYLEKDSEGASVLRVEETLIPIFPEYDQNHGIARAIPEKYEGHKLRLDGLSVTDESNKPLTYTTEDQNDNLLVKIQNPGVYVHGRKVYKINYNLHDVVKFFPNQDELFWDINGDQWAQVFGSVTARIHIPKNLVGSLKDRRLCYTGSYGSTSQNCSITLVTPADETYITVVTTNLQPNQTLSVVLGFESRTFAKSQNWSKAERKENIESAIAIVFLVSIPLYTGIFMYRRWRQFGDDPKGRGIIIPEYEPPKDLDLLSSDFLLNQTLSTKATSATIIDLAVKGHIDIYEIPKKGIFGKKDYELLLKDSPQNASEETLTALRILFGAALTPNTKIKLSDFKKSPSKQREMYKDMEKLEDSMSASLHQRGYFVKNPKKVKNGYLIWGGVMVVGGYFAATTLGSINPYIFGGLFGGIGTAGLITIIFAFIMPARTLEGVAAHDHLLGLKDYMKLAEADRLKFLQSPEGSEKITDKDAFDPKDPKSKIKLFEKLLPYAILFGLEKDWAKQFNDIYVTPPGWYHGGSWSSFNAGYLAGSLSGFSSAASGSFASPSSSSTSGFSGGGAGGGGGGGGGGGI